MLRVCTCTPYLARLARSSTAVRPWMQVLAVGDTNRPRLLSTTERRSFRLKVETVNPYVIEMEYAVRGKLPIEASKIENDIKKGVSYPFDQVLYCNIGDCHAVGQKPLTFVRQLLAACLDPKTLLEDSSIYPSDVRERAKLILDDIRGNSLGGYSDSRGIAIIRKHVAEFISARDRIPCNWEHVYLLNGGTEGIKILLYLCMSQARKAGIMIPIPQYPLYSASITEMGAHLIKYYLDEGRCWAIDVEDLRQQLEEARKHCEPRIMVVVNPGNPTGQYLPRENMEEIVRFCHEEELFLFADEVYQENVYAEGAEFHSFRKVVKSMGPEYREFQLASFNSTSKGFLGECGMRGGYMEMMGIEDGVLEQLYKFCSTKLCPNTPGQVVTDALVKRPQPGDPSYELFEKERTGVLAALKHKARMVYERMNQIPGVHCNEVQGAMYAFPTIEIPEEAWEDARREDPKDPDMSLDTYYCLEFLRQKGVCVVPGSGFGQKEGTWHFRTTILPSEEELEGMLDKFTDFHSNFLRKYGKL